MDAFQLAVYIWMYVAQMVRDESVSIPDMLTNFTEDNNNESILGTLLITDFTLTGLESITNEINNIVSTEDEDGNNNVCMYLPIGYLQLTTNYVADIGIANEIPIYGDGRFLFTMNNIELNMCAFFNFNERYVDQVTTRFSWRHSPVEFTGFLKNKEVSEILELLLNIANRFYAMWSAYEPHRGGCLVSPFLEYGLNDYIDKVNNTISFENTEACLQGIFTDDTIQLSDYQKLKEYLLHWMETEKDAKLLKDFLDDGSSKRKISDVINIVVEVIKGLFNNH